jgi:4-carboxymuconolactone decarboxylase
MREVRERGIDVFGELLGDDNRTGLRNEMQSESRQFGSQTAEFAADFAFGTIWPRAGLERKQRSLVVLGILIAQRQTEELKIHVGVALSNGLTKVELEEVLYQSLPYAGFPAVNSAKVAMLEALRNLGVETAGTPVTLAAGASE